MLRIQNEGFVNQVPTFVPFAVVMVCCLRYFMQNALGRLRRVPQLAGCGHLGIIIDRLLTSFFHIRLQRRLIKGSFVGI